MRPVKILHWIAIRIKMRLVQAIEHLTTEADHLMEIVDDVNGRISNLAASTEEIAASASMIGEVSDELEE